MKLWFPWWRVREKKGGEDLCIASKEKPKTGTSFTLGFD
jgi:hypothetical protein